MARIRIWNEQISNRFYLSRAITSFDKFYRYFPAFILEWNPETETIYSYGSHSQKYLISTCSIFLVNFLGTSVSCLYTLYKSMTFLDVVHSLFAVIFLVISYTDGFFARTIYKHGNLITFAFARIKALIITFSAFTNYQHWSSNNSKGNIVSRIDHRWKIISQIWTLVPFQLIAMVVFFPTFFLRQDIDPYKYVFALYFNLSWKLNCAKFIVMTIFWIEGTRLYAMLVLFIFYWLEMQNKCLDFLEYSTLSNQSFISFYHNLQICTQTLDEVFSEWIRLVLTCLFSLITICCMVSIKYIHIIPSYIFLFPASLSILGILTLYFVFPCFTESNDRTKRILKQRKNTYLSKQSFVQIRALRPILITFGELFPLKQKTKATFYGGLLERTISLILV